MNKTSVLHAPDWAHQGEFIASGTIWNFSVCVEDTADSTSSEGVTYVHNIRKLKQISSSGDAQDQTALMYMAYKFPTEEDYNGMYNQSAEYMVANEGVIGLMMHPGIRINEYVGTDYTNTSGTKMGAMAPISWSAVSYGTLLYLTDSGQFTTATTNAVARAQLIEYKNNWVTIEIINPRI